MSILVLEYLFFIIFNKNLSSTFNSLTNSNISIFFILSLKIEFFDISNNSGSSSKLLISGLNILKNFISS